MTKPVDDALFADIAPHYAERAAAEAAEYAEIGREWSDAVSVVLGEVAQFNDRKKDPRKHTDKCYTSHADCLANKLADILGYCE